MSQPLISVIVPVYNVGKYLDECIDSIVNQTYKNLEIILIDDGSQDKSPEICDNWAENDSRVIAIHKENGGAASARNYGLDAAKGEYIGFVDSDDYIEPNYYEFLYQLCTENDADIARCTYQLYIEFEDKVLDGFVEDRLVTLKGEELFLDLCKSGHKYVINVNKLINKKILGDVRFDSTLKSGEDLVFNYFAYKKANKMICHDLPLYHYRITGNQQTFDKSFNYKIYVASKKIISDPDCPTCMYYRYYSFSSMLMNDIVIKKFDYSYDDIVKELRGYKRQIVAACKEVNNRFALIKFKLLLFSPFLYKILLRFQPFLYKLRNKLSKGTD